MIIEKEDTQKKYIKKVTERDIQNQIRNFLKEQGYLVIRHQQGLGCKKGMPDLSAVKNGKTIYIEIKTKNGKQSEWQKMFQQDIESHGAQYIIARCIQDLIDANIDLNYIAQSLFKKKEVE